MELRLVDLIHSECPEEDDTAQQREDAYRQKVLEAFFDGEQLLSQGKPDYRFRGKSVYRFHNN